MVDAVTEVLNDELVDFESGTRLGESVVVSESVVERVNESDSLSEEEPITDNVCDCESEMEIVALAVFVEEAVSDGDAECEDVTIPVTV